MILPPSFLSLPSSLLLLLISQPASSQDLDAAPLQWPYNLPAHVKYWPEDPPHRRRDLEAIQVHIREGHEPVFVRKMSEDEGEMFFPEYWGFGAGDSEIDASLSSATVLRREIYEEEQGRSLLNVSAEIRFRPPFANHGNAEDVRMLGRILRTPAEALTLLQGRAFQCPAGTAACTSISQPDYCCATGERCVNIVDTGLGPVGCCPNGVTCGGGISSCAQGYTACSKELGGACCIPGYSCAGTGCISGIVVTVISTVMQGQPTPTASVPAPIPTTSTPSTTSTSTTATNTALQTTATCGDCYKACPINLGGGCCLSDRVCQTGNLCPLSSNSVSMPLSCTVTASPPVKGTSVSSLPPSTSQLTPTSSDLGNCPTGFYACSAYYPGAGCCRVGRDCSSTSCPVTASTTLISAGLTVVVPLVPSATTTADAKCASAWSRCTSGACCPDGWSCGVASCTAPGATATVGIQAAVANFGVVDRAGGRAWWVGLGIWSLVVVMIGT